MKKGISRLLIVILIIGSIIATYYFINKRNKADIPDILRSAQIEFGDLTQIVSASGNIIYHKSVDLFFKNTGPVEDIYVEIGNSVKKGQILATLDTTELDSARMQAQIALEQAELNLQIAMEPADDDMINLAEQSINSAAQALESARLGKLASQSDASSLLVQAERDREAAYIKLREASDSNKESAQNAFNTAVEQEAIAKINAELIIKQAESSWWSAYYSFKQAESTLQKLKSPPDEQTIEQLELQVTQAQLNLDQAETRLDDTSIVAPFDGNITQINVQKGVIPKTTLPAVKMVDKSEVYLEITIDEIDIGKVSEGMSVTVKLDAYPESPISGDVYDIAPSAVNIGGIVSYKVRIHINETEAVILRDGMTASADILVGTIQNVLLIPNWAVRTNQDTKETYCYRIIDDMPIQTAIQIETFGETTSSILSGLQAGDIVGLVAEERSLFDPDFRPDGRMRP